MITQLFFDGEEATLTSFIEQNKYSQIIILTDENTHKLCLPALKPLLLLTQESAEIIIPQGEQHKTIDTAQYIWTQFESLHADKSTLLIHLGGGMLSDIGGFAASVYKRGINTINIPTTLLAMVDASIGGKTGLDFNGIKNNIGSYHHPLAVYFNPIFLHTLSKRILISGIAETLKHALISNKIWWHEMLSYTEENFMSSACIQQSIQTKIKFVDMDEFDGAQRQALNFGHTIGHAIESYSFYTNYPLLHGEAILLGMLHELKISEVKFGLSESVRTALQTVKLNFFPSLSFEYNYKQIEPYLLHDKKNHQGIRMSLLKSVGDCCIQVPVSIAQIQDSCSI